MLTQNATAQYAHEEAFQSWAAASNYAESQDWNDAAANGRESAARDGWHKIRAEMARVDGLADALAACFNWDTVQRCPCGEAAEYEATGLCRDCHESQIDYAMTVYEASYREMAL